jgi:hypothetical protein
MSTIKYGIFNINITYVSGGTDCGWYQFSKSSDGILKIINVMRIESQVLEQNIFHKYEKVE